MKNKLETYKDNNGNEIVWDSLLPCPFCGSKPELSFIGNDHTRVRKITVKCTSKDCRIERTDAVQGYSHSWLLEHSVDSWNKRDVIQAELSAGC